MAERLLDGERFRQSTNEYDWLGPGSYFWEANPLRGLSFSQESARRKRSSVEEACVVGAVLDLGFCLDLTTSAGIAQAQFAYESLIEATAALGIELPTNNDDGLRRNLDCAVIRRLHEIREIQGLPPIDTVKGIFIEGGPIYPTAGFHEKNHVQIAVRNLDCIKGVFRVPDQHLRY